MYINAGLTPTKAGATFSHDIHTVSQNNRTLIDAEGA